VERIVEIEMVVGDYYSSDTVEIDIVVAVVALVVVVVVVDYHLCHFSVDSVTNEIFEALINHAILKKIKLTKFRGLSKIFQ